MTLIEMKPLKRTSNGESPYSHNKEYSHKGINRFQLFTLIVIPLFIIVSIVLSITFILYKFNSEVQLMKSKFASNLVKFKADVLTAIKEDALNRQIEQIKSSIDKIKKYAVLQNNIEEQIDVLEDEMYDLIPKGFVYTQLVGQKPPKELWPQFDWINISHLYQIKEKDKRLLDSPEESPLLDNLHSKRQVLVDEKMWYKLDILQDDYQPNHFINPSHSNVITLWQRI